MLFSLYFPNYFLKYIILLYDISVCVCLIYIIIGFIIMRYNIPKCFIKRNNLLCLWIVPKTSLSHNLSKEHTSIGKYTSRTDWLKRHQIKSFSWTKVGILCLLLVPSVDIFLRNGITKHDTLVDYFLIAKSWRVV